MRLLLLMTLALLGACQTLPPLPAWQSPVGREHADLGVILDLRDGSLLQPEQLVSELAAADQVLVGERHDNPDHHALQLWLLHSLAQRREQGSLLMEMLVPAQQQRVDAAQAALAAGRPPEDLPGALGWQGGWDWSLYGPLVTHALAAPYPLLHANLDAAEITAIYRDRPVVTGAPAAPVVRQALLDQIRLSHCDMLPEAQLPAMLAVQQQRDQRMAERLASAPTPSLLLAGAFHVRRDLGVPLHLHQGQSDQVRVLVLAEVGQQVEASQADFVWYTPAMPAQDYCASFRKRR